MLKNGRNNVIEVTENTSQDSEVTEIKERYMCDYCEIEFNQNAMLSQHMSATHVDKFLQKLVTENSVEDESFEGFDFEYTPKKAKPEEQDAINVKGNSDEFKDASEKILRMMENKDKKYLIWGREIQIISVRKSAIHVTIGVKVTTKQGDAGEATLMIYKKGNMRLTKKKGEDVKFAKLSQKV